MWKTNLLQTVHIVRIQEHYRRPSNPSVLSPGSNRKNTAREATNAANIASLSNGPLKLEYVIEERDATDSTSCSHYEAFLLIGEEFSLGSRG